MRQLFMPTKRRTAKYIHKTGAGAPQGIPAPAPNQNYIVNTILPIMPALSSLSNAASNASSG